MHDLTTRNVPETGPLPRGDRIPGVAGSIPGGSDETTRIPDDGGGGGAAAARDAARGRTGAARPKRELLKLGVASYSLRKFPFDKALEMAKACDTKYINFKDVHMPRTDPPEAIKAARAKTEAAGLHDHGRRHHRHEEAGREPSNPQGLRVRQGSPACPLIVAAPSLESLDIVEKLAKEFQIKVAIHNHGPEDKIFPSPYDVYKAIKGRDKRWASAWTSATRGAPASIRPRRSSSCAIASTICTSRISPI